MDVESDEFIVWINDTHIILDFHFNCMLHAKHLYTTSLYHNLPLSCLKIDNVSNYQRCWINQMKLLVSTKNNIEILSIS